MNNVATGRRLVGASQKRGAGWGGRGGGCGLLGWVWLRGWLAVDVQHVRQRRFVEHW